MIWIHRASAGAALAAFLLAATFGFCGVAFASPALDEKRAEADALMEQVNAQQDAVNEANDRLAAANAELELAQAALDEAQQSVDAETAHIERLEETLGSYSIDLYKQGGSRTFLQVLMDTRSFEEFIESWEALVAVTDKSANLVAETREARESYVQACEELARKAEEADARRNDAQWAQEEAARCHDELVAQLDGITAEIASLEAQEELSGNPGFATMNCDMGGMLANPCPDALTSSDFGYRDFDDSFHLGLDLAAPAGTPYYAAESGTVICATNDGDWNGGAGNWIVIAHGGGIVTKYMHSSTTIVAPGDSVLRGQLIGYVGETGEAFGAHLHFQVEVDGTPVDPLACI